MVGCFHVLVVEDDPAVAGYTRWLPVQPSGPRLDFVTDTEPATQILRRVRPGAGVFG